MFLGEKMNSPIWKFWPVCSGREGVQKTTNPDDVGFSWPLGKETPCRRFSQQDQIIIIHAAPLCVIGSTGSQNYFIKFPPKIKFNFSEQ